MSRRQEAKLTFASLLPGVRITAVGLTVVVTLLLAPAAGARGSGDAVTYQIDTGHSGVQVDAALTPPFVRRWTVPLPAAPSYALIAEGKVFAAMPSAVFPGQVVYALDQIDGHTLWTQTVLGGDGTFGEIAYDEGRVFVQLSYGTLTALDASNGNVLWSRVLPGQHLFSSAPTAVSGVVYTGGAGSGGTVYAVDEATGDLLGTRAVMNGDNSSPAVGGGRVYVGYACNQVYAFDALLTTQIWHVSGPCQGGGGTTTVLSGGRLFTKDFFGNLILDAATGQQLGTYPSDYGTAAVDDADLWTLASGALTARDVVSGAVRWTFVGDGRLVLSPIVNVTPTGRFVLIGSASGQIYALDDLTGSVVWSTSAGRPITSPDDVNISKYPSFSAGAGLFVVPAGNVLIGLEHDATPPPTCDLSRYLKKGVIVLRNANLSGCSLPAVNLNGLDAAQANMHGVNFRRATFVGTNLSGSNMKGAVLVDADLGGARMLQTSLAGVYWGNTRCPDLSNSDANGGTCVGHLTASR